MSTLSIAPYFPFARVKVVGQTVHNDDDAHGVLIRLEPDYRFRPLCHACGASAATVHSKGHRRILFDLPIAGLETWLQVDYRKVWCEHCQKARVEKLGFAQAGQRITHRLARYIYDLCKMMTAEEVARHLGLHPQTVRTVDHVFLKEEFGQTDYSDLEILAVDEISLRKGQYGYMTVVLDYLTGRVVWMGEGHSMETLDEFFAGITAEQKAQIKAVAMDMWEPFINRFQHHCPQAKIVFDLFHLVKGFGRVIDEVRRGEYRKARDEDKRVIKGSRYLLLKNADNLTDEQRTRLEDLLEVNAALSAVYVLKDQLKMIYRTANRDLAKRALDNWCDMAAEVDHPLMKRFIGRLRFFEYGILNHCDYSIGTSKLEGVNNKIKVIKRRS